MTNDCCKAESHCQGMEHIVVETLKHYACLLKDSATHRQTRAARSLVLSAFASFGGAPRLSARVNWVNMVFSSLVCSVARFVLQINVSAVSHTECICGSQHAVWFLTLILQCRGREEGDHPHLATCLPVSAWEDGRKQSRPFIRVRNHTPGQVSIYHRKNF